MTKNNRKRILKGDLNPTETTEFVMRTGLIWGNDHDGWEKKGSILRESSVPYDQIGSGMMPPPVSITVEMDDRQPAVFRGEGMTQNYLTFLEVEGERLERESS